MERGESNPYKPGAFDPAGMMVAPLGLLGLVLGRKKKRGKWDTFIALLVVCVVVGMSVSACTPVNPIEEAEADPTATATATATPIPTDTPSPSPTSTQNISPTSTSTVTPLPTAKFCVMIATAISATDIDNGIQENNDIPLTYRGQLLKERVEDYNEKAGWWNNYKPNSMTLCTFLGIWTLWERSTIAILEDYLVDAVKNQLWMNDPDKLGRSAFCTEQACHNGVYNFMALEAGGHNAKRYTGDDSQRPPLPEGETLEEFVVKAQELGRFMLTFDPERTDYDDKVAWNWGNDAVKFSQIKWEEEYWGYEEDQIVAAWPSNFVLFTIGQANHYGWLHDDEDE